MVDADDSADGESGGERRGGALSMESPLPVHCGRIGFSRIVFRRAVSLA